MKTTSTSTQKNFQVFSIFPFAKNWYNKFKYHLGIAPKAIVVTQILPGINKRANQ